MTDSEFLSWIRDRLVLVYNEPENVDFVLRLEKIIKETENKEIVANVYRKMSGDSE